MKGRQFLIILLLSCYLVNSYAWNSNGHRVVAQIAYDQLSLEQQMKLNKLINASRDQADPDAFIKSADWADKIRQSGDKRYVTWHYINKPYIVSDIAPKEIINQNIIWAIRLNKAIFTSSNSSVAQKAFALRMLIHLFGDIHQPLHCITRYDENYPKGDYGGNLYFVKINGGIVSLHQYWDSEAETWGTNYFSMTKITTVARQLEQEYPAADFAKMSQIDDPSEWAEQSYQLAIKYGYSTPRGAKLNTVYKAKAKAIARQQIALAGYRLAKLLKSYL